MHDALPLGTCQNGFVVGEMSVSHTADDPQLWMSHRLLQLDHRESFEETIASHQQEFLDDGRSKSTLFHDNSESNQMHIFRSRCICCRCIFLMLSSLLHNA